MTPEKIVEKLVLLECLRLGLDVDVIESKATFSQKANRYKKSKAAPEGFPDLVGNDQNGNAVYIELKAEGKIKTLRPLQRLFLERKILMGCFAVVIDSPEFLTTSYLKYLSLKPFDRITYLKSILP